MLDNIEEIKILFRRIYGDVEKQKTFAFTTIENKFLAHALLQLVLYSEKQNCCISFDDDDVQCINDGAANFAMSPKAFVQWMKTSNTNPASSENIRPETYYFYKCAINMNGDFANKPEYNVNDFELYKQQYNIAKEIFLEKTDINKHNLPKEIQSCISNIKIDNIINMTSTTLEIKNIVEKYANYLNSSDKKNDQKLGVSLKKLLKSPEFEEKYKNSEVSNFKLFVIKCIYFVKACIMFFFSSQNMQQIKEDYNDSINSYKKPAEFRDFKDFILKEIQHHQNMLLRN